MLSWRAKEVAIGLFDAARLSLGGRRKLVLARALAQAPVVLPQEAEQSVERAIRHIDDRFNQRAEAVEAFQEPGLLGQVALDRLPDAGVKKLGMRVASKKR